MVETELEVILLKENAALKEWIKKITKERDYFKGRYYDLVHNKKVEEER
jgi:hypothetical protein